MNNHQVNFSMTTDVKRGSKTRFIAINMRIGDHWFITGYDEINGDFYNWDFIDTCKITFALIEEYFP